MDNNGLSLAIWQVGIAYVFVIIVLWILKSRGISREKTLLIASFRMTFQLVLAGYLLVLIIDYAHPLITALVIIVMVVFSIFTILTKFKGELTSSLKRVIIISMPMGTIPVLAVFLFAVIQVKPYYNPQFVIPLTGMIVGNSMTGISLGIHTMLMRFKQNRSEVEEILILGGTPAQASKEIINDAFDSAIMPTLNSMLGMGIIFLPGMMTGQILSGVTPTLAIMYQIAVMLGILGGVSLTTYFFLKFGYRTFFNKQKQLL